jgi:signal transduction histidine kinase
VSEEKRPRRKRAGNVFVASAAGGAPAIHGAGTENQVVASIVAVQPALCLGGIAKHFHRLARLARQYRLVHAGHAEFEIGSHHDGDSPSGAFADQLADKIGEVADVFRDRILDQHILRYGAPDASIREEVRDREALDGAAREQREDVKRRGVGDAIYKVSLEGGQIAWLKDMARIETHGEDGICLSCGCLTPVTKERKAEAERLERERLEVSLQMAGAVCHEMNQPMQSISGYAESLLMNIQEGDPLAAKFRKIIDLTRQMGQFTRKLTRITRYETKDYIEGIKIVDVDRAIDDLPDVE